MSMRWPAATCLMARFRKAARRHALQNGVDGGEHHGRVLAAAERQLGERGDALGHDLRVGTDAVVGHGVPGGNGDDAHGGCEEGQRPLERVEPAVVAGDVQQRARRMLGLRLGDQLRQHQRVEPFGHAGDDALARRSQPRSCWPSFTLALLSRNGIGRQSVISAQRRDQRSKRGLVRPRSQREPLRQHRVGHGNEALEIVELGLRVMPGRCASA